MVLPPLDRVNDASLTTSMTSITRHFHLIDVNLTSFTHLCQLDVRMPSRWRHPDINRWRVIYVNLTSTVDINLMSMSSRWRHLDGNDASLTTSMTRQTTCKTSMTRHWRRQWRVNDDVNDMSLRRQWYVIFHNIDRKWIFIFQVKLRFTYSNFSLF